MISCNAYDYIEIACLYELAIKLVLLDGSVIEGIATDTIKTPDREEAVLIKSEDSKLVVVLENIKSIQALTANPHFDLVYISS